MKKKKRKYTRRDYVFLPYGKGKCPTIKTIPQLYDYLRSQKPYSHKYVEVK